MTEKLLDLHRELDACDCTCLIKFMVDSNLSWKCKHINYLVAKSKLLGSGIASTLSCNLSEIPWKSLLQKDDVNLETIQVIIPLNGQITPQDVVFHVKDDVSMLQLAIESCDKNLDDDTLIQLCEQAIKSKKFNFSKNLINCLKPTGNSDKLVELALKSNSLDMIEILASQNLKIDPALIVSKMKKSDINTREILNFYIMSTPKSCAHLLHKSIEYQESEVAERCLSTEDSEGLKKEIDLSSILCYRQGSKDERQKRLEFIEKLLAFGCDPNGLPEKPCPLDVVMELTKEYQQEKESLLMLLLKHGVAIQRCTYQRQKGTTLIHEAIRFAIDSGKIYIIII